MAVNRFSPIQKLPEWQPQIPLDILVSGLTYKQELFDKNKAILDSNIATGKGIADSIVNDEAAQYTRDKINNYKTYLNNNLAYADLTDETVMKAADTKLTDVSDDNNIISWAAKSRAVKQEQYRMDELKKKGDARYDQLHENSFLLDYTGLKKAKMNDGLNMATPSYTDFYDADKEKQELIKNFKPNHVKYSKVLPGGRMMEIEDQSVYQDQLQAYLEANLSDKAKRELYFRGEYEYKAGYQYETDPTKKQNFVNNISSQYVGAIDAQIKATDVQIQVLKEQQFKLDPKDKNYDAELANNKALIDTYEQAKQKHLMDKSTFLTAPEKYTKEISQRLYASSYVNSAAKANVRADKSEVLKVDEAYWNGLDYQLQKDKFAWDMKNDVANRELEYYKAGVKLDANGKLVSTNAFGTPGSAGEGFQNLSYGGIETTNPTKNGGMEFINEVENNAVVAKNQIYNDYFRKWEQEAAGPTGFFTAQQKADWNKRDAAWKKAYFEDKVLPLYHQYMEGNNFSMTMPDGTKVTRNANYVPQWFKDMRNDPRYRNTYTALSVATTVKNKLAEGFKDYEGKFKSPEGKNLNAMDLAKMSELQKDIEESLTINDAYSLQNLLTNIDNYIASGGGNTGTGWDDFVRSITPGNNYSTEEINALAKKFGGIENLKTVTKNLLHNTNQGKDLVAFGGQGLTRAAEYAPGGATVGAAIGLIGGPAAPLTSSAGAGIGALIAGGAGFIYGLSEELIGDVTKTGFESLSDDARESISKTINGMVINQPTYNVINKETDFYKKVQNPQALALANTELGSNRVNGFSLNSNSFEFEGLNGAGEMTFSYTKGDLSQGKSYQAMTESLSRIANSSAGIISYDGEANTLKIKVDPKKIGILQDHTDLYHSRTLFESGLISALPKRDYYARDPKQNAAKGYSYQFSKNSAGQTELAFYRDNKKITIPRITEAEATAAGIMVTSDILDLDPSAADLNFTRNLFLSDSNNPGRTYNSLDKLINYAENNQ